MKEYLSQSSKMKLNSRTRARMLTHVTPARPCFSWPCLHQLRAHPAKTLNVSQACRLSKTICRFGLRTPRRLKNNWVIIAWHRGNNLSSFFNSIKICYNVSNVHMSWWNQTRLAHLFSASLLSRWSTHKLADRSFPLEPEVTVRRWTLRGLESLP